jgi:aspartyl-tRNA(Asn)/glutamyl-tRNA(Gln) amidotransferase subunit B
VPIADFQPVIGLEVHAQLLTQSKIFSGASTAFGAEPNVHTTEVCLGMPGALPVLNEKVVELAVRAGLALNCEIRLRSVWARKHYFYPDLPKGYQITQYEEPICERGYLAFFVGAAPKHVRILRIHMEEDAGKSIHEGAQSLVDLNRAGTPLLEIVSEPDLRSSEEAAEYLKTLRDVLVYLGVNDGNLEEGSFRCDANVSVMRQGTSEFGTRVELKNLNSFRFVKQAIDYEIARQVELVEGGGKVVQQTRLFDSQRGETRAMRSKEDAQDYRYFPDPDLPPLQLEAAWVESMRAMLPELPLAKAGRYVGELGLSEYDAKLLTADKALAAFFEGALGAYGDAKKLANWCLGELARQVNEKGVALTAVKVTPAQLGALLKAIDDKVVSNNAAKEVFAAMFESGADAQAVITEKGLGQVSDTAAIEAVVDEVLAKHPAEVAQYKAGKVAVFGFFVGQVMKAMKGKGNPASVNALLKAKLGVP